MGTLAEIIFHIILGGALIVCGAFNLGRALERMAGSRLLGFIKAAGGNDMAAFTYSAVSTAALQSSSAVTAITVGFAESGVFGLTSAMAAVYGANIGTTVSAQLMSINISSYGILLIPLGVCFLRRKRLRRAAIAIISVGLIFTGLKILSLSAALMVNSAYIMNFIRFYADNLIYCVFFGFITTALIQSSSASVGVTITLFSGGVIGLPQAVAITLGDNIGTCITALMASAAGGVRGRRVAWGHMLYNIICGIITFVFIGEFVYMVEAFTAMTGQGDDYLVANAHMLLNVLGAVLFLPLNRIFCRFLEIIMH